MALDFPSAPTIGQTYPGPNGVTWAWDGAKWTTGATAGPPNGALVAATPPSSPVGTLWYDSTGGNLYVSYNDGNTTQWVPASNIAGLANAATTMDVDKALNDVGRNLIHNAGFTIAQRGNGPWTVSGSYTVDRWMLSVVLDTATVQRFALADSDRTAIGDEAAAWCLSNTFTGNAGATAGTYFDHRIEGVRRLSGKTIVVSFWATASAALKIGVNLIQWFGTGGSPSGAVYVQAAGATLAVVPGWNRYSATFTMPSMAGKTLGTNNDDSTYLRLTYSSGANNNVAGGNTGVQSGTLQLWGIQLEVVQPGQTVPSKLEKMDETQNINNCFRFYQVLQLICNGYAVAGVNVGSSMTYRVPMRPGGVITPSTNANVNVGAITTGFNSGGIWCGANVTASGAYQLNNTLFISADL